MTEKITDVTALACKKKFLEFVTALSNKYPPMTFQEYKNADGNHTSWFPQRVTEDYLLYRQWFTLAVLNNFEFMLRIKQHDVDAINLFESIINNENYSRGRHYKEFDDGRKWELPKDLITLIFNKSFQETLNFKFNCNIHKLIDYYNRDLQINNINETSSAITIKNNLTNLYSKYKLINELKMKKYIRDVKILRKFNSMVEKKKKT